MGFFNRQGWGRTLLLAAAVGAAFATGAVAQEALVPFIVNVNATVSATDGVSQRQITVTTDQETLLRMPLQNTNGVRFLGTQRAANVPTIISNRNGKVILNLSAQTYKNAEISLYTVNGKRILHYKASASSAVNNISRRNITTGVYLLSVRGADGVAVTSRMTHNGGGLDISVVFSGENSPSASRLAKKTEDGDWMITVAAPEYVSFVYTLRPVAGTNPLQNITLQKAASGGDGDLYESVVIGGLRWMKKNLNIETSNSWCYNNSPDSCAKYGRLYTWETAKAACLSYGWRLPDVMDWDILIGEAGGSPVAGKTLKSTSGWNNKINGGSGNGTDKLGFSALPGGGRLYTDSSFYNAGIYGYWWTASDVIGYAYHREMWHSGDAVSNDDKYRLIKSYGFSVRCVKDESNPDIVNTVTVVSAGIGATGNGDYAQGVKVSISAGTPPSGQQFKSWTSTIGNVKFVNANSAVTAFIMPANAVTVTAVFEDNAVVVTPPNVNYDTLTDIRDGQKYKTVKIGDQTWMAENLNYGTRGSWCYYDSDANCVKYGMLYTWAAANTACPTGWRLPTRAEWGTLAKAAGGTGTYGVSGAAGNVLKSTSDWGIASYNGTDDFGFSALPGGYRYSDGSFDFAGYSGYWWTATDYLGGFAYYRRMYSNTVYVDEYYVDQNYGYSVRCLKDD